LKERRPLVLVIRETPLHYGHLRLMAELAQAGAILLPPVPAFYHRPKSLDDIVNHTVGKILDILGIEHSLFRRWAGMKPSGDS
jgi:4-hydroxy-3-polyprenylbenzoate decarboxylase